MKITEIINKNRDLCINKVEMDCDHILSDKFPTDSYLSSYRSGFCQALIGPSNSGKTNWLVDMLLKGKKKGIQTGFRGIFNNVFVVSPSMGTIKSKKNPFLELPEEWIRNELSVDVLEEFKELCLEAKQDAEENNMEKPFNLLILDDCASLLKDKYISPIFKILVANRRHTYNCSIIFISQYTLDIPPSIRSNLTHCVIFYPKSLQEKEYIYMTWVGEEKKFMKPFYKSIFKIPHDYLLIDMTLQTGVFRFYRQINEILID